MRSIAGRLAGCCLSGLAISGAASAQAPLLSKTLCKQWDDVYLGSFESGFIVCAVATFVLALLAGLLGRWLWIAAAPRLRILVVAILVVLVVELGIVALPWMIGFGWLWFSPIDTAYFDCIPVNFGAEGFFAGLIGPGVAAVAQWPTMTYLLLVPAAVAGLLAWLISELVARFLGLRRRARTEGV